jgi:uncharacterized membrane protein YkvA (DUF1232 family)
MWWHWLTGVLLALLLVWLLLMVALWLTRPEEQRLRESLRLLPDVVRLLGRLARDRSIPFGVRIRLWLLLTYLAMPIDLVPDFIPVLGYADDAILVAAVLRSVARRTGRDTLARHWPGSPEGLAAVGRLAGIADDPAASP